MSLIQLIDSFDLNRSLMVQVPEFSKKIKEIPVDDDILAEEFPSLFFCSKSFWFSKDFHPVSASSDQSTQLSRSSIYQSSCE